MENICISGKDVTQYVNQYVKATKLIRLAETGRSVGYSISELQKARADAVAGVAKALSESIPDPKARNAASIAVNSYFVAREVTALTNPITFGQFLGIIGAVAGIILGLGHLFGAFGKTKKYIELRWIGNVNIKVNFSPSGVSVSCEVGKNIGNIKALQSVMDVIKRYCQEINRVLSEIPIDDVNFIKKYLPRPPNDVFTVHMEVIVGDTISNAKEAKRLVAKFNNLLAGELTKVLKILRQIATNVSALVFIEKRGVKDALETSVLSAMPSAGYQVEGMWRKELERLSIRLVRTREYDRQIDHALRAAAIQTLMDMILSSPNWGSAVIMSKNTAVSRIQNLCNLDTELRYGFDLIKRKTGAYKPKKWLEYRKKYQRNILGSLFPSDFLETQVSYVFKPVISNGKIKIAYIPKNIGIANRVYVRYDGWYYCASGQDSKTTQIRYDDCFRADGCMGEKVIGHKDTDGKPWILPRPSIEDAGHPLIDKILGFINYLLSEIPEEAAKYVAKNISTVEGYLKYHKIYHDPDILNLGLDVYISPRYGENIPFPYRYGYDPSRYRRLCMAGVLYVLTGYNKYTLHGHDLSVYIKNISSIRVSPLDREDVTNICRVLNDLILDIVDAYNFWLKGYALEWKKRVQTQLLEQALPQLRMTLLPVIIRRLVIKSLPSFSEADTDMGRIKMERYVLSYLEKQYQETKDYVKYIQDNRDFIISTLGADEYNRLLQDAMLYQERLEKKIGRREKLVKEEERKAYAQLYPYGGVGDMNSLLFALIGYALYKVFGEKKGSNTENETTGLGATGIPRKGRPKTEEERKATHRARFGNTELPPRGTGLRRRFRGV